MKDKNIVILKKKGKGNKKQKKRKTKNKNKRKVITEISNSYPNYLQKKEILL